MAKRMRRRRRLLASQEWMMVMWSVVVCELLMLVNYFEALRMKKRADWLATTIVTRR